MTPRSPSRRSGALCAALLAGSLLLSSCGAASGDALAQARDAYAKGDLAAARIHVESALQGNADDAQARLLLGTILLDSGDGESAEVSLRRAIGDAQVGAQAQEKLGQALIMQRKGEALMTLLDGKNQLPAATADSLRIGALQTMGRWDEADAALALALKRHPSDPGLQAVAADRALSLGQLPQARAYLSSMTKGAPEAFETLVLAGRIASIDGDLKQARVHFTKARTLRPGHVTVLYALGGIANDLGEPAEAEKLFAAAQAIRPKDPIANYFLAQLAFDKGDVEGADRVLMDGDLAKAPMPQIAMLRGLIEAKRGEHWKVVPLLAPYVGNGGPDPRARFALAEAYLALNKPQDAWQVIAPMADAAQAGPPVLALAAKIAPLVGKPAAPYQQRYARFRAADPIAAPMAQAQAAMAARRWAEADDIYTRLAASGQGKLVPLLNNHALVKLEMGDSAAATDIARQARELAPHDPIVADTLGWVIYKAGGSTSEAKALLAEAAEALPRNAEIAAHLREVRTAGGLN